MDGEKKVKSNIITFRVDDDAYTFILNLAEQTNRTPSEIARNIIDNYFLGKPNIRNEEQKLEYMKMRFRGGIEKQKENIKLSQQRMEEYKKNIKEIEEELERLKKQKKK